MTTSNYTDSSIEKLDPRSFSRLRPDTYCGSTEDSTQLCVEVVTNAIDEHLIGNCNHITVTYADEENIVTVEDDGQGIIPSLYRENGRTVLEMVYGDINVSGKFDKSSDAVYKVSTGAFGIGASLANYLSHWLEATTFRDGKHERVLFEEGLFKEREEGDSPDPARHGVVVRFQPSEEFFTSPKPNLSALKKKVDGICCLCPKLTVSFCGEEIKHNGITDLLCDCVADASDVFSFTHVDPEDDTRSLSLAYGLKSPNKESAVVGYANYGAIEGGTAYQVIKTQLSKSLTDWGRKQAVLKPKETLNVASLQDDMCLAFNLVSQNIRYDSQTKVRMSSTADNQFMRDTVARQMERWMDTHPNAAKAIIERAVVAKRAAEAAKKAREAVRGKSSKKDSVFKLPTTLVDASSRKRAECELWVVEGKSAQGGMVAARDSKTQAIYGVRGMMLNVLKTAPENIMKNQEINNLVLALGLDVDVKTGKMVYNPKKLRYGKIIACSDADSAGAFISSLLFNILWYMCPELFLNGHVYKAEPALFRITTQKNEYIYCKDQVELEKMKKKCKVKSIGRNKGIGESSSEELEQTLLNPETRNLIQLNVSNPDTFDALMTTFFGKAVEPRVDYILEHSEETDYDCE